MSRSSWSDETCDPGPKRAAPPSLKVTITQLGFDVGENRVPGCLERCFFSFEEFEVELVFEFDRPEFVVNTFQKPLNHLIKPILLPRVTKKKSLYNRQNENKQYG